MSTARAMSTPINELCLFIGGVADGKRIVIPRETWHIKYPAFGEAHAYRGELLEAGPDTKIRVFVHEGIALGEAIRLLNERYRGAEEKSLGATAGAERAEVG